MLEDVQTTSETSLSSIVSFVTAATTTSKYECIQSNNYFIFFKVGPMQDYAVQSSPYVSFDQYTCVPVASQSADISLAGQFVICTCYVQLLLSFSAIHSCCTSVCVDVIIIDWTHFSCSNNILDETETQTTEIKL